MLFRKLILLIMMSFLLLGCSNADVIISGLKTKTGPMQMGSNRIEVTAGGISTTSAGGYTIRMQAGAQTAPINTSNIMVSPSGYTMKLGAIQ